MKPSYSATLVGMTQTTHCLQTTNQEVFSSSISIVYFFIKLQCSETNFARFSTHNRDLFIARNRIFYHSTYEIMIEYYKVCFCLKIQRTSQNI